MRGTLRGVWEDPIPTYGIRELANMRPVAIWKLSCRMSLVMPAEATTGCIPAGKLRDAGTGKRFRPPRLKRAGNACWRAFLTSSLGTGTRNQSERVCVLDLLFFNGNVESMYYW